MSNVIEPGYVVPTPQPVKTIGLLNIVFASLLILMSLIGMISYAMMPYYMRMMQVQQQTIQRQVQAQADTQRQQATAQLDEQLKRAKTDEEKALIVARKEQIKNLPKPFTPDVTVGMKLVNKPGYRRYQWTDYLTGIPLNLAMLVSGIALLRLKRWGRTLANTVAVLKLSRAVVYLIVSVLFIAPDLTRDMGRYLDDMGRQIAAQQPAKAQQIKQAMGVATRIIGAIFTATYALMYVLAMIYPVVLLVILNKPGARAALVARPVTGGDVLS